MNKSIPIHPLLRRIARIERMERGKLCPLAGRPQYNHQTWQDGRNISRYVRLEEVDALREAIEGYRLCRRLMEQYVDVIIRRSRAGRARPVRVKKAATRIRSQP